MAWTKQQRAAHSKRMKAMWERKAADRKALLDAGDKVFNTLPQNDVINHPSHYTSHPSGVECIQVTEHMNFNRGNAVKYIWRAGEKGNEIEDLKKAKWYIDREIQRLTVA